MSYLVGYNGGTGVLLGIWRWVHLQSVSHSVLVAVGMIRVQGKQAQIPDPDDLSSV
jgi:hypothetical protein